MDKEKNLKRDYVRCSLSGEGELFLKNLENGFPFQILDASASGIKISIEKEVSVGTIVTLKASFYGHLCSKEMNLTGEVVREENGKMYIYAIEFVKMTQNQKIELDELFEHAGCTSLFNELNTCEDGKCMFNTSRKKAAKLK